MATDAKISGSEIADAVAVLATQGAIWFYTGPLVKDDERLYAVLREAERRGLVSSRLSSIGETTEKRHFTVKGES